MMGDFVRTGKEVVAAYLKCYPNVPPRNLWKMHVGSA